MSRLRFDGRAVCDRPGSVRYSVVESSGYVCDRLGPIDCVRGKARQHPALAGGGVGTAWAQCPRSGGISCRLARDSNEQRRRHCSSNASESMQGNAGETWRLERFTITQQPEGCCIIESLFLFPFPLFALKARLHRGRAFNVVGGLSSVRNADLMSGGRFANDHGRPRIGFPTQGTVGWVIGHRLVILDCNRQRWADVKEA